MKSALALLALAFLSAACAPGAPQGPAGIWQGERIKAPREAAPDPAKPDGGQKEQEGPSISSGLTEALGGDSLELKPDGAFVLKMAGAEIEGAWKQEKGFILLTPTAVMGQGPAEAPQELKDFFEPVSLGASADQAELVLAESGPWPGLRFRRAKG